MDASIIQLVLGVIGVLCAVGGFVLGTQFTPNNTDTAVVLSWAGAIITGIAGIAIANGAPLIVGGGIMLGALGLGFGIGLQVRRNNVSD